MVGQMCWVTFRGFLLAWIMEGQEPTVLAAGVGEGCLDICSELLFFPLSGRQLDRD